MLNLQMTALRSKVFDLDDGLTQFLAEDPAPKNLMSNCVRCRNLAEACVGVLLEHLKIKAQPAGHKRAADLSTMIFSLQAHYEKLQDEDGLSLAEHLHFIRKFGNKGAHGGNGLESEFDAVTVIFSTLRVVECTIGICKLGESAAKGSARVVSPSPPVAAHPPSNYKPSTQPSQAAHNARPPSNPSARPASRGWFPAEEPSSALLPPGLPVSATAALPVSLEHLRATGAASPAPASAQHPRAPPKQPGPAISIGGGFAALMNGNDIDDDDDDPMPTAVKAAPKPSVPAGRVATRNGPVGADHRPEGAPVKPKQGANLPPPGPPRQPGAPAPPRPGRRRKHKNNRPAPVSILLQEPQLAPPDAEVVDEEDPDPNIELLAEDLLLNSDEADSSYLAICGLDPKLDPITSVYFAVMERTEALECRSELIQEKLFVYIQFSSPSEAGKCYELFQWENFGGEPSFRATCWYVRSFPEHLTG